MNKLKFAFMTFSFLGWIYNTNSYAGNLEPCSDFDTQEEFYSIIQDNERVGYAKMGFRDGNVIVSVINTTGSTRNVTVECELNHSTYTSHVKPGALKNLGNGRVGAQNPVNFKVTRDFCGWGAINVTFR